MASCPFCRSGLDKVIWKGDIGYDSYLCGTRVTDFETVRSEACKAAELERLRTVNAELLAALRDLVEPLSKVEDSFRLLTICLHLTSSSDELLAAARAAIAKASEVTT